MKKVLALVLAAVMTLSLSTVVSALELDGDAPGSSDPNVDKFDFLYGDDSIDFFLENTDDGDFDCTTDADGNDAFYNATVGDSKYSLSVSAKSDNSDVAVSTKLIKDSTRKAVSIKVTINPADEKFTVEDSSDYEITLKVVQVLDGVKTIGEKTIEGTIANSRSFLEDVYSDASDKYIVDDAARVIDAEVFDEADGNPLAINYEDYSVNFTKVKNQNTDLYLYADTDVADGSKAIASIKFSPTRVKDAATITMPISEDNENLYGEKVFVYALVNGKPSGDAIEGDVINHNSVIFTVPAGTTLGTWAAYGAKTEGDAEKPAIPETGANDIVNIAIVFAVVALAAAGFVAVKKASK